MKMLKLKNPKLIWALVAAVVCVIFIVILVVLSLNKSAGDNTQGRVDSAGSSLSSDLSGDSASHSGTSEGGTSGSGATDNGSSIADAIDEADLGDEDFSSSPGTVSSDKGSSSSSVTSSSPSSIPQGAEFIEGVVLVTMKREYSQQGKVFIADDFKEIDAQSVDNLAMMNGKNVLRITLKTKDKQSVLNAIDKLLQRNDVERASPDYTRI